MSRTDDVLKFLVKKDVGQHSIGYDGAGSEVDSSSSDCVAKLVSIEKTGVIKHFVRVCRRGIDIGTFFNPQVHAKAELFRFDGSTGRMRYDFTEVSPVAFDTYVAFLKSGNTALLRIAQRN
jgi:hypothetical protein